MPLESSEELIQARLNEGAMLRTDFGRACAGTIQEAAARLVDCLEKGNKILLFGNGGSAADAQHFAAELVGRFGTNRAPLPAIALTTDSSALTAIGNDYGFDEIFARQVRALAHSGDLIVAISTSGRSPNVVKGLRAAQAAGMSTITLTGGDGGEVSALSDTFIVVPSANPARIQEVHIAVIHILCELVESSLFPTEVASIEPPRGIVSWSDLLLVRDEWKREGKIVVWTNGCFDVLHVGHLHSLEEAKRLGDVLVVGVNSDASVHALKGSGRPVFPLDERMRLLSAFETTDYVVTFEGDTPEEAIAGLKPDIHVKGEDYAPASGKQMPERAVIESYGGKIEFVSLLPGHSSSATIQRLREGRVRLREGRVTDS